MTSRFKYQRGDVVSNLSQTHYYLVLEQICSETVEATYEEYAVDYYLIWDLSLNRRSRVRKHFLETNCVWAGETGEEMNAI